MKRAGLISIHSWAGHAIIWSYMFSVHIYKIWYIVTALVAYLSLIFVLTNVLRIKGLIIEGAILLVYFIYLATTALWSIYPVVTLRGVLIDFICFVVFIVSYLTTLNSPKNKIIVPFLALPIIGLISTFAFYDPDNIRVGEYVYLVLPITLPFVILSILTSRGMRLYSSLTGFLIVLGVTFVSMSRTSVVATIMCALVSFVAFSRVKSYPTKRAVVLLSSTIILASMLLVIPVTRDSVISSISRIHDTYLYYAKTSDIMKASGIQDRARDELTQDVIELIPVYWSSGMGYRSYEKYSEDQYGRARNLHSIYHIWLLEGGLTLAIIAGSILVRYYYRMVRLIKNTENHDLKVIAKAYLISMSLTLTIGLFHQTIQAPIFFLLLGGGLALTHQTTYQNNYQAKPARIAQA